MDFQTVVQMAVLRALELHPVLNRHAVARSVDGADSKDVERAVELLLQERMIELEPGGHGGHAIPPLRLTEPGRDRLAGVI